MRVATPPLKTPPAQAPSSSRSSPDAAGAHAHLLVCVTSDGRAPAMVAHARQLHLAMGGSWSVVGIDTPDADSRSPEVRATLLQALHDAERAGAATNRINSGSRSHASMVASVVRRARSERATALLVSRPEINGPIWRAPAERLGDLADELVEQLPGVLVHVIATADRGDQPPPPSAVTAHATRWTSGLPMACIVLVVCTLLSVILQGSFDAANLIMVYLAGIVFVALRKGAPAALFTVLGSVLLFDLVDMAPRWSLKAIDPQHVFSFAIALLVGLIISQLAAKSHQQARTAEARAQRAQALNQFALQLVQARSGDAIAAALSAAVFRALGTEARLIIVADDGRLPRPDATLAAEWPLAEAALRDRRDTGTGTLLEPAAARRYMPLVTPDRPLGLLAVAPLTGEHDTPEDDHLLKAFANQTALALERADLERRSATALMETETERLRSTLLAGISHDFRTPLTTIVGSMTTLLEQSHAIDEDHRVALLRGVLLEAQRMNALSSDLLDLTRMQEGAVRPSPEWCPADDLIDEAVTAMGNRLDQHRVRVDIVGDPVVWCDPRLVGQALVNLLDNAVQHSPAGCAIRIGVERVGASCRLVVQDNGPGVPPGQEHVVFRKFVRGHEDSRTQGTGLGLAICAVVAQLHGGTIAVTNADGARFEMSLPQPPDTLDRLSEAE